MVLWSRYVSPVRFLLLVAFTGIAFALASWTSAAADDTGLFSAVDKALPTVGEVVDDTTSAVVTTSSAVPGVELEPVAKPAVTQVAEVVDKPVKIVDRTTTDVVEVTTKALSDTTVRVTDTVKEIAPVSAAVVDPVVEVVETVEVVVPTAPVEESVPSPQLPDAGDEVVDALDPEGAGSGSSGAPVPVVKPGSATSTAPDARTTLVAPAVAVMDELRSPAALSAAASSAAAAPVAVARVAGGSPAERLPAGQPAGPLAVSGGSAPSPGGASASGATDAGLTPSSFELPEFAPSGVTSELSCHAPGPCPDPGSRPG